MPVLTYKAVDSNQIEKEDSNNLKTGIPACLQGELQQKRWLTAGMIEEIEVEPEKLHDDSWFPAQDTIFAASYPVHRPVFPAMPKKKQEKGSQRKIQKNSVLFW
jgi:hypothetical protein